MCFAWEESSLGKWDSSFNIFLSLELVFRNTLLRTAGCLPMYITDPLTSTSCLCYGEHYRNMHR